MSDNEISAMALDDVLSFNEELLALAKTGLPIELAPGDSVSRLSQKLAHGNAQLALQVGRGRPLEEALAEVREFTPEYRAALETWLRCDKSPGALDALTASAEGRRKIQADIGYSLLQPVILLCLLYFGFSYIVLTNVPVLETIYAQIYEKPGPSLQMLTAARRTQPVWGVTVPLLVIAGVVLWRSRAPQWEFRCLPWRAKTLNAIRKANYAESVAGLVEKNYSLAESLRRIGPLPEDDSARREATAAATQRLIDAEQLQVPLTLQDPALQPLPPMLRWVFTSGLSGQPLANVLHFTSRMYLETARRKLSFWRVWLPIVFGAVIGGTLVLLYGLSLFMPMIELLKTLTRP
jgi:type II secretory pathway component PulF